MANRILVTLLLLTISASSSVASEWCTRPKPAEEVPAEPIKTDEMTGSTPKCSMGAETLFTGRLVNGSSSRDPILLPSWVNLTLAKQGQKWASDHIPFISSSHIFGLIFVLTFPDAYTVLLFTNQSDTPDRAAKRYQSTIEQVNTWYNKELKLDMDENDAVVSLSRVRGLHTAAMIAGNERLHGQKGNLINSELYERIPIDESMWAAFKKDLDDSKIPEKNRILPESHSSKEGSFYAVSQFQLAMTQYAFVGFPVLFPERLMILDAKEEDLVAYNHLWAVLGYALGIDDEYNVALQPDLNSTREYYQQILDEWYIPNLFNIDFHCKVLLEAMLKGFEKIEDVLTPKNLLMRLLRDIVKIPVPNMLKEMSPKDHAKMAEFYGKGIQGYLQKIKEDIKEKGFPAVIQHFKESGGPGKLFEQIRTKVQEHRRQ